MSVLLAEYEARAGAVDRFEGYGSPHGTRLASRATQLAAALGLTDETCLELRLAALVHDIGEELLGLDFLRRPHPLSFAERLELWRHPVVSEQFCGRNDFPKSVQLLVRWHHENWNGSGYPDGLRGEDIPLPARVLRAADVFCALTADRPFRQAYAIPEALAHLRRMAGIELDPVVVCHLIELETPRETIVAVSEPVEVISPRSEPAPLAIDERPPVGGLEPLESDELAVFPESQPDEIPVPSVAAERPATAPTEFEDSTGGEQQ